MAFTGASRYRRGRIDSSTYPLPPLSTQTWHKVAVAVVQGEAAEAAEAGLQHNNHHRKYKYLQELMPSQSWFN